MKTYLWMSFAAVVNGALRVNNMYEQPWTGLFTQKTAMNML